MTDTTNAANSSPITAECAANSLIRRLIADDAHAITFQTMGQYRTALLKAIDAAPQPQGSTLTDEQISRIAMGVEARHPEFHKVSTAAVLAFARAILAAAPSAPQQAGDGLTVTDDMVSRFLGWRLPDDFYPDCGVSFKPPMHEGKPLSWPTGTNLLHAGQARQMLEHVLAAPRQPGEMGAGVDDKQTMFIVRKPGLVPRLGRPLGDLAASLREWYEGNPGAKIDLLRVWGTSVGTASVDDGREWQSIFDPEAYKAYKSAASAQQDSEPRCDVCGAKTTDLWLDHRGCQQLASAQQDERETPKLTKREAVEKVQAFCNRIPGSTQWNAAEFMFDLLTKGSIE